MIHIGDLYVTTVQVILGYQITLSPSNCYLIGDKKSLFLLSLFLAH
ncbi:hypothetical protein PPIS_b0596 [Pseudoalteromonas piscicida]|uniref:Uncharacterized protein n=1 Tax=Pseudoalteromonas piscicida TaxID=43662 RepID=A0ABM6NM74_PSEO7|nr:hypothetical protein PPIS_b0596 [Pseudoalteromonas piscicida]